MKPKPTKKPAPGRSVNGRFAAGNAGGPGRPPGSNLAVLRDVIVEVVTADDVQVVVRALVAKARRGERWATTELLRALAASAPPPPPPAPPKVPALDDLSTEEMRELADRYGLDLPDDDASARERFLALAAD